jgi:mRNA interferase RelE/StbE
MTYEIRLARQSESYIRRLDPRTQDRILQRLEQLASDPFDLHYSKPLRNAQGKRSSRVGEYRIVFSVDSVRLLVNITAIGPRGRVYRDI